VQQFITKASHMLAIICFSSVVHAQQPPSTSSEPVVVVSGEGLVRAAPDQAFLTLAVESRNRNPKDAQAQNATAMSAVQQKLSGAGLAKDAIRTLSVQLDLESDWVNGRQVPKGYAARNMVEVRVDDVSRVGEIIDLAIGSGVTNVHGVRFDVKQRDSLEREALKRATANARARAEAAAAGAGRTIDRVLRIEEPSIRPYPVPSSMMMGRVAAEAAAPQTPVVAAEIEIRAAVVLTAAIK
jgi:uncharacterized protein YggE